MQLPFHFRCLFIPELGNFLYIHALTPIYIYDSAHVWATVTNLKSLCINMYRQPNSGKRPKYIYISTLRIMLNEQYNIKFYTFAMEMKMNRIISSLTLTQQSNNSSNLKPERIMSGGTRDNCTNLKY